MSIPNVLNKWIELKEQLNGGDKTMLDERIASKFTEYDTQTSLRMLVALSGTYVAPLLDKIKDRLNHIDSCAERPKTDVRKLLLYGQRLTCILEPPPMYNDPKGEDADCYPGRKFPCPDSSMLDCSIFASQARHLIDPVMDNWDSMMAKEEITKPKSIDETQDDTKTESPNITTPNASSETLIQITPAPEETPKVKPVRATTDAALLFHESDTDSD